MKKALSIFLSFALFIAISIPVSAQKADTIDSLLAPYQLQINKLNLEIGSSYFIPEQNKGQVYANIKGKTPIELANMLKCEYGEFLNTLADNSLAKNSGYIFPDKMVPQESQLQTPVQANSIFDDIRQTYSIQYNSLMYLDSEVYSVSGNLGTFIYQTINGIGTEWPSDYTGYHFESSSGSYSVSSDRKQCTVTMSGYPVDSYGVALAIVLHASHTFSAN